MSTMNMKPDTLIILAAVGIGAYWFFRRKSNTAAGPALTYSTATGGNKANQPAKPNFINGILAGMDTYLAGQPKTPAVVATDGNPTNSPTAYLVDEFAGINGLF